MNRYPVTTDLLPATGLVDEIWEMDAEKGDRVKMHDQIRGGRFDAVLLSYATPISAFSEALLSIPVRVGHTYPVGTKMSIVTGEYERRTVLNRRIYGTLGENAVARNLDLVRALDIDAPIPAESRPRLPETEAAVNYAAEQIPAGKSWVGIHLGAPQSQYGKLWDADSWGRLCRRLTQEYDVGIVFVGAGEDRPEGVFSGDSCAAKYKKLWGDCGLVESLAVIRRCKLFLASDTGLAKSSIAMGVPTVTIWGPTDPGELQPPWDEAKHLNIRHEVPCQPCVRLGMPKDGGLNYTNCGHRNCLTQLTPDAVFQAIREKYGDLLKG